MNFRLREQKLFLDFKNPWKIVVKAEPEQSEGEATIIQNSNPDKWRRVQDSNLRGISPTDFQDRRFKPLSQPSKKEAKVMSISASLNLKCKNHINPILNILKFHNNF